MPGLVLPITVLIEKDRKDLVLALDLGADCTALSVVQRPEDVSDARELICDRGAIVVKLEKPSAVERLDEIVAPTDAVRVPPNGRTPNNHWWPQNASPAHNAAPSKTVTPVAANVPLA